MAKTKVQGGKKKQVAEGGRARRAMPEQKALTGADEIRAVGKVLASGRLTSLSNKIVEEFEKKFAAYCGVKHGVAVNSGTAALHVALAALDIGPGDEVIVPPYTFIATASAVLQQNAVPVFADIDPTTLNLDPDSVERRVTPRTKAIIPVHLFGLPADMRGISRVAKRHGLTVIEDACQAHGAVYHGKKAGSLGRMGCFSFQESKNMTCGEGGMVVTNDAGLAERCRIIRHIGMKAPYQYVALGYNYRLPAMSAAVGLEQLNKLDGFNTHRRRMAKYYREALADTPLGMTKETPGIFSANHLFPVTFPKQIATDARAMERIREALVAENVPVWWVYPEPINKVEFVRERRVYGNKGCPYTCSFRGKGGGRVDDECPTAEDLAARTLALPTAPCFSESVARDTVDALKKQLRSMASDRLRNLMGKH